MGVRWTATWPLAASLPLGAYASESLAQPKIHWMYREQETQRVGSVLVVSEESTETICMMGCVEEPAMDHSHPANPAELDAPQHRLLREAAAGSPVDIRCDANKYRRYMAPSTSWDAPIRGGLDV